MNSSEPISSFVKPRATRARISRSRSVRVRRPAATAVFIDILGAIGLTAIAHMPFIKALISNLVFIPGDTIKALVVVLIYRRLKKMNIVEA